MLVVPMDHQRFGIKPFMLLAFVVPFIAYALSASGYAHWLDSGEFVAVAADFSISHPPGHPLSAIAFGAAKSLPFGSLAFRVAILCAFFAALAAAFLFRAYDTSLAAAEIKDVLARRALCLAGVWWLAGSYGWWVQAVRPEVYALQALLICALIDRWTAFIANEDHLHAFFAGSLLWGLALSNHHYIALLILPAALPTLIRVVRRNGTRALFRSLAWVGCGLLTYLFLPLRAMGNPYLNLGDPDSPGRFLWTVSAQAFQKSLNAEVIQPLSERIADVFVAQSMSLHGAVFFLGALGLYLALRSPFARRAGLMWGLLFFGYVLGRAALGFTRSNPDALGYVLPAMAAAIWLALFAIAAMYQAFYDRASPKIQKGFRVGAIACAALSLFQFPRTHENVALTEFVDTDVLDHGVRRSVPFNAVVFVYTPQTMFRFWGGQAEENDRPDITMVPVPFLTYPHMVEQLIERSPDLKPVLRSFLIHGEMQRADLQSLATTRPVMIELDLHFPIESWDALAPAGYYYQVIGGNVTKAEESVGAQNQARYWQASYNELGLSKDHETKAVLLWRHYLDALYYARFGDVPAAKAAVDAGKRISPSSKELNGLAAALANAKGSIDISEFTLKNTPTQ